MPATLVRLFRYAAYAAIGLLALASAHEMNGGTNLVLGPVLASVLVLTSLLRLWLYVLRAESWDVARFQVDWVIICIGWTIGNRLAERGWNWDYSGVVLVWLIGTTVGLLVVGSAAIARAHRERLHLRCPDCGYVLVGLRERRCPECGRPFTLEEIRATESDLQPPRE